MIVVSDTSCISNLVTVEAQSLLPALFDQVFIPPTVLAELKQFHTSLPSFLHIQAPSDTKCVERLKLEVDAGEAEAIALALELGANRVLIDETIGRGIASREGLHVVGVLGVLLAAKHRRLIPAIRPLIDRLQSEAGFYVAQALRHQLLAEARELE